MGRYTDTVEVNFPAGPDGGTSPETSYYVHWRGGRILDSLRMVRNLSQYQLSTIPAPTSESDVATDNFVGTAGDIETGNFRMARNSV